MTGMVLEGSGEPNGRARAQIAVTVCAKCRAGTQDGAGATIAISAAAVARAECDAQHIGALDAEHPARAHQDVAPAVARLVFRRDHGRCRVPGCRSARALEIHHIVHREHGGGHDADNLVLLCSSCHTAHHDGRLSIRGTATALDVRRSHVGLNPRSHRDDAKAALVIMGWKPKTATAAIERALTEVGDDSLETLIRTALRHCA